MILVHSDRLDSGLDQVLRQLCHVFLSRIIREGDSLMRPCGTLMSVRVKKDQVWTGVARSQEPPFGTPRNHPHLHSLGKRVTESRPKGVRVYMMASGGDDERIQWALGKNVNK